MTRLRARLAALVARLGADGRGARLAVWLFVVGVPLQTLPGRTQGPLQAGLYLAAILAFLAWELQQQRLGRWGGLVGLAVAVVGIHDDWILVTGLGLAIIAVSLPVLPAVLGATALVAWAMHSWIDTYGSATTTVAVGVLTHVTYPLFIYLLERVATAARELRATREDLADIEVDVERTRLAEELNAVIGSTLHQVAHQAATTRRELTVDDPQLAEQLDDVATLVARGLEQLELLSFESVLAGFQDEVATAQALCKRLGVEVTVSVDEVDARVDDAFALVVRESVTNMFKHAVPARCTVTARMQDGTALLAITNDGVPDEAVAPRSGGSGHERWRTVLAELGGTLVVEELSGGRYRVLARVAPAAAPVAEPPATLPQRADAPRRSTRPARAAASPERPERPERPEQIDRIERIAHG
ncbi:sensor histidine kinase [Nocardioides litoris]|uniref:sensor histidine kinase n=1 Tax=Nocardioides litoris TaxID=1926648 RepID=UPI001123082E|nr:hypothetical protein [Nocardioides litoris]